MVNPEDYIFVAGNFLIESRYDHTNYLKAGTIEIRKNFIQNHGDYFGCNSNFAANGTHKVILSGDSMQIINFDDPGDSYFNILDLKNTKILVKLNFDNINLSNPDVYFIKGINVKNACAITAFDLKAEDNYQLFDDINGIIDETNKIITIIVPDDTDLSCLVPTIRASYGSSTISPNSCTIQDFSNPVTYIVSGENGAKSAYTVYVKHESDEELQYNPYLDYDQDGLSNYDEMVWGTDIYSSDTDQDGLRDSDEIKLGTDPLNPDTDEDGIYDGAEVKLSMNPLVQNANIVADNSVYTIDGKFEADITGDANIVIAPLKATDIEYSAITSLNGVAWKPVYVTAGGFYMDNAALTFRYADSDLNGVPENKLSVYYINPKTKLLEPLENVNVDAQNNILKATARNLGVYLIANSDEVANINNKLSSVYDDMAKQFSIVPEAYTPLNVVSNIKFSDSYNGYDNKNTVQWITDDNSNLLTGNYIESKDDIEIKSEGIGLNLERTYNSSSEKVKGSIGNGFRINYDSSILTKSSTGIVQPTVISVRNKLGAIVDRISESTNVEILKSGITDFPVEQGTSWCLIQYVDSSTSTYHSGYVRQSEIKTNNILEVTYPSGTVLEFTQNTDGTYNSPSSTFDKLQKVGTQYIITRKDLSKLVYNEQGKLIAIKDKNNNALTISYSGDKINAVTDPTGRQLIFNYNPNGLISKVTDPVGRYCEYEYDALGNLIVVKDLSGNETHYEYDNQNRINKEIDANNHQIVKLGYDNHGRIITQYDGKNHPKYYFYNDAQKQRTIVDENNNRSIIQFNQDLRPIIETDVDGKQITHKYLVKYNDQWKDITSLSENSDDYKFYISNIAGKNLPTIEQITDKKGLSTTNEYDARNNLVKVTDPQDNTTEMTYDSNDNMLSKKDNNGNVTTYKYDAGGINLLKEIDPLNNTKEYTYYTNEPGIRINGLVKTVKDKTGAITTFKYEDPYNNHTQTINACNHSTFQNYDIVGRIIQSIDANGNVTKYEYDNMDRPTKQIDSYGKASTVQYDNVGNKIATIDKKGNKTQYVYDENNQLIKEIDPLGNSKTYTYDVLGNKVQETNEIGAVTNYSYDNLNRLTSTKDALGKTKSYQYDVDNNKTKETDELGNTTTYDYDTLNRLSKQTSALSKTVEFTYDPNGNVLSQKDCNGNLTKWKYDGLNRKTNKIDANNNESKISYDGEGREIQTKDELLRTTSKQYDAVGNLLCQTDALGKTITYKYDGNGNAISQIDQLGRKTTSVYDQLNRKIKEIDPLLNATEYGYDDNDNQIWTKDSKGNTTYTSYDELNRPTVLTDVYGNKTTTIYDYVGNKQAFVDQNGNVTRYEYDLLNRLVKKTDALNNITTSTYDAAGNKTTQIDALGNKTTYVYDVLNRLVKETDALENSSSIEYDGNDNITAKIDQNGNRHEFTYDNLNRLTQEKDPYGNTKKYVYNAVGNKTSVTDANNHTTTFIYDALNREIKEIDPMQNSSEVIYDEVGNKVSTTHKNGNITRYVYNDLNQVTSVINADGGVQMLEYDSVGNNTAKIDENANRTEYMYDALNRQIGVKDSCGYITTCGYDPVGNKITQTDQNGNTTTYVYDALNRLIKETDALKNSSNTEYDGNDNVTANVDKNGNRFEYSYDNLNRLTQKKDPYGNTKKYGYDAVGNKTKETNENNNITTYEYDALNREVKETDSMQNTLKFSYDAVGNKLTEVDKKGNTTTYAYDSLDRVISKTDATGGKQKFEYDPTGNNTAKVDKDGNRTEFIYDVLNRQIAVKNPYGYVTSYAYDDNGNKISVTDAVYNTTTYSYDALNRLIKETDPMQNNNIYEYDGAGNKTAQIDKENNRTSLTYDALNRLVKVIDAEGTETKYAYDSNNNLTEQIDGEGNSTKFEYDKLNRKTKKIDPRQKVETYLYDPAGNLIKKTDRNLVDTAYIYDNLNRLIMQVAGKSVDEYSYDANDNRITETNPNVTINYTYDILNRVTQKVTTGVSNSSVSYKYDKEGNKINVTDSAEGNISYAYDAMNRLSTVTSNNATTSYTYDAVGNRKSFSLPNGVTTTYEYDSRNLLTKMINNVPNALNPTGDSETVSKTVYSMLMNMTNNTVTNSVYGANSQTVYDTVYGSVYGHTSGIVDANINNIVNMPSGITNNANSSDMNVPGTNTPIADVDPKMLNDINVYEYGYNKNGKQTYKTEPKGRTDYEYDTLGRLSKVTEPNKRVTTYSYDKSGNRKKQTVNGAGFDSDIGYNYDQSNRLTSTIEVQNGKTITTDYSYDDNGNQIKVVETSEGKAKESDYIYNELNQMIQSDLCGGTTTTEKYDADGLRIQKTESVDGSVYGSVYNSVYASTNNTTYVYDGTNVLLEMKTNGIAARNIYGINLLSRDDGQGTNYYIYNGHADVVELTDDKGNVVNLYDYDEFGNPLVTLENKKNPYRYSGYYYDTDIGYYYLKSRYYDPKTARFITEDTYTGTQDDPLSLNLYTYCEDDPLDNWDPDGHKQQNLKYINFKGDYASTRHAVVPEYVMQQMKKAGITPSILKKILNSAKNYGPSNYDAANLNIDENVAVRDKSGKVVYVSIEHTRGDANLSQPIEIAAIRVLSARQANSLYNTNAKKLRNLGVININKTIHYYDGYKEKKYKAESRNDIRLLVANSMYQSSLQNGTQILMYKAMGRFGNNGNAKSSSTNKIRLEPLTEKDIDNSNKKLKLNLQLFAEGANDAEKILWGKWSDYKKATVDGKDYAVVGDRLYTQHAVERMQPSGMRYSSDGAGGSVGASRKYEAGQKDYGRSISPNFVEDVIKNGKLVSEKEVNGVMRQTWKSGTVEVVTEQNGKLVVTIMTK